MPVCAHLLQLGTRTCVALHIKCVEVRIILGVSSKAPSSLRQGLSLIWNFITKVRLVTMCSPLPSLHLAFYMDLGDSNLGLYNCGVSVLPIEPSPLP